MDYRTITFTEPEPGIGQITLNRPERLNAINLDMLDELEDLYARLTGSTEVRALIVTGAGRGFCSGADLLDDRMVTQAPHLFGDPATFLVKVQKKYANLIIGTRRLPQPVIAAVNGAAAGGGMCLALAADVILAGPRAKFLASFINIGLSGGELGSSYFLPRLVGYTRAAEILLTGRSVEATEAERIGLVARMVPEETLVSEALTLARTMLTKSDIGLRLTKETLTQNQHASSPEAAIELENRNQAICAFAGGFRAAVEAFARK